MTSSAKASRSGEIAWLAVVVFGTIFTACLPLSKTEFRGVVSDSLDSRIGVGLRPEVSDEGLLLAEGLRLDDGLTESEAVAIALWNNAAFQLDLASLGFARADLIEAGLLRNPILSLLFPLGPKQLEATAMLPIEVLFQRPRRVAMSTLNLQRVAEGLVQNGLDVGREARLAHAAVLLASERSTLAQEAFQLSSAVADITESRLKAGDISVLDLNLVRNQARLAGEEARRNQYELVSAEARLRFALGLVDEPDHLKILPSDTESAEVPEISALIEDALASRPDLRAAELAMESAGERAGLAKAEILQLSAGIDVNEMGLSGPEAGPGVTVALPFLNRNEGDRARAQAELDRAARDYAAVRHRIVSEVREARARFLWARDALDSWRESIVPSMEEAFRQTEMAYTAGEVSYLAVLEANRRLVTAKLQEVVVARDFRSARAESDWQLWSRRWPHALPNRSRHLPLRNRPSLKRTRMSPASPRSG